MAKLKDVTELSGLFGESITIRKVNGRVVVTNRPKKKRGEPTEKEIAHRARVSEAAKYAKSIADSEELRALYATGVKKKHESPQSVAIGDFMNAPEVKAIEVMKYTGAVGDSIEVHAVDDFQVTKVTVTIIDANSVVIEQGDAIDDAQTRVNQWKYKTTVANTTLKGTKIMVIAYDRPGNQGSNEIVL
ncbi:hypothetical protein BH10BAC4_BH10BAC4_11910 [soil metagenome]